jgi:predicted lipid-binding transport protein (Tim44 family)
MGARVCKDCFEKPVMKCGRCTSTRCQRHALQPGQRCDRCERDWAEEAATRRAAKLIFAPPISILAGGLLFGLLLPVSLGGAIGAAIMCAVVCCIAVGAGAGACRLVDHSARVMFLRERAGSLPAARLLPSPKR